MYVEGVANKGFKAGASSRPPVLRIATPFAVPLLKSSNLDCSQVRVPSANAGCMAKVAARGRRKKARATFDKFRPREWVRMGWQKERQAVSLGADHLTVTVRTCVPETT